MKRESLSAVPEVPHDSKLPRLALAAVLSLFTLGGCAPGATAQKTRTSVEEVIAAEETDGKAAPVKKGAPQTQEDKPQKPAEQELPPGCRPVRSPPCSEKMDCGGIVSVVNKCA